MSKTYHITSGCGFCGRDGFKNIGGHYSKSPACNAAHKLAKAADCRETATRETAAGPAYWLGRAAHYEAEAAALAPKTETPAAIASLPTGHPLRRLWAKTHPGFQA